MEKRECNIGLCSTMTTIPDGFIIFPESTAFFQKLDFLFRISSGIITKLLIEDFKTKYTIYLFY